MNSVQFKLATTLRQFANSSWVRYCVYTEDTHLLAPRFPNTERDIDAFDALETTSIYLAYCDGAPVGTVRLLTPNRKVAHANQIQYGLPLETKVNLSELSVPDMVPGEISSFCILKEWRATGVFRKLCAKMYDASARLKVTHWVGAANLTTDCPRDADLLYTRMEELGLTSRVLRVSPRQPAAPTGEPRSPLYSAEVRRRYERGDKSALKVPSLLEAYAKVGAVFVGRPVFDRYFNIYFLPLIASLDDVRAYLRRFPSKADVSRECPVR